MSREFNVKVHEALFGSVKWVRWSNHGVDDFDLLWPVAFEGKVIDCNPDNDGAFPVDAKTGADVKRYSIDFNAAWEVVLWLHKNHYAIRIEPHRFEDAERSDLVVVWSTDLHPDGGFAHRGKSGIPSTQPERVAEAICLAALEAVRKETAE